MLNESYIIIFCRTIYFDMLYMQHSNKQELNNIFLVVSTWNSCYKYTVVSSIYDYEYTVVSYI